MAMVETIYTIAGFETRFLERLKDMTDKLPTGVAETHFEKKAQDSIAVFPYFRIVPSNERSAPIKGFFIEGEGITFSIGHGTSGEIYISGKSAEEAKAREDEFFGICQAVITTRSYEKLIYNSDGQVIWARMTLRIGDCKRVLGNHRAFWWLCRNRTMKEFSYEPYY
jgi:hypothetical protein